MCLRTLVISVQKKEYINKKFMWRDILCLHIFITKDIFIRKKFKLSTVVFKGLKKKLFNKQKDYVETFDCHKNNK